MIVPITILRFPLLGILASIVADASDWMFIGVTSSEMNTMYQNWDKAMDLYSLLFIVWIVLKWKDVWAKRMALGFFGYRAIGDILLWTTGWRPILFFFPNVFENFVILCLIIFWLSKKKKLSFGQLDKTIMLGVLIIPKMIHEYFQHFLARQPWEIFSFGDRFGFQGWAAHQADLFLWIGLLYIVPMAGFLLYTKDKMKQ